jgi:cytochrome P450
MPLTPIDDTITFAQLVEDPYPVYRRLRMEAPICRVPVTRQIFITRAEDTAWIKANPDIFISRDDDHPMSEAMEGTTLMRKDGMEHRRERMAMAPALSAKTADSDWGPLYRRIAEAYLDRLPRGETVDLFKDLCAPVAARILAAILGMDGATDDEMLRWSQGLIDGSGNFARDPVLTEKTNSINAEINAAIEAGVLSG